MARIVFDIDCPTVGLLNVGTEEIKGVEEVKAAGRLLRDANLPNMRYHGFVEGDDLGKGAVDVFVTEGFTGNIALKTAEGTARQLGQYMRDAFSHSLMSRIGFLFARKALDATARANGAAERTAACSSALTASSSRLMAAPTPTATPAPSNSATTWFARSSW